MQSTTGKNLNAGRACVPEVAIRGSLAMFEDPQFGEGIDEIYDVALSGGVFEVRRRNGKK